MKKVLISNLASPANPGDQAILRGALKLLREVRPGTEVTLATRAYSEKAAYEKLGCRVVPNYPRVEAMATDSKIGKLFGLPRAFMGWGALADAVEAADAVFLVGGGYFYSYKRMLPGLTFLAHCMPVWMARHYGRPVYLLPQSYGPILSAAGRSMFRGVAAASRRIFYREERSAEWLRGQAAAYDDRFAFMPDLALYLRPEDCGAARRPPDARSGIIGVTLRPWNASEGSSMAYQRELLQVLSQLVSEKGFKVRVIAQVRRPVAYENDEAVSRAFAEALTAVLGREHVEFCTAEPYFTLDRLCALVAGCDVMIAMRLHSALLAMIMGCPALVTGYQHKAEGVIRSLGLDRMFLGTLAEVRAHGLAGKCLDVLQNRVVFMKAVDAALDHARAGIRDTFRQALAGRD